MVFILLSQEKEGIDQQIIEEQKKIEKKKGNKKPPKSFHNLKTKDVKIKITQEKFF